VETLAPSHNIKIKKLAPSIFHLLVVGAYISPSLCLYQPAVWHMSGGSQTAYRSLYKFDHMIMHQTNHLLYFFEVAALSTGNVISY